MSKKIEKLVDEISGKVKSMFSESSTVLGKLGATVMVIIFILSIFGLIYGIYYFIAWVGFWLFGPTIFGYTMSWKAPLMLLFIAVLVRSICKK